MITRKKSRLRLRIIFFLVYILLFILFIFIWPRILKSYFSNSRIISPISEDFIKAKVNSKNLFSAQLVKSLSKAHISFVSISSASDSAYIVTLAKNKQVIFSQDIAISKQVSSLQVIQSRLTIEGKDFTRLDFRFANPVIVLNNSL